MESEDRAQCQNCGARIPVWRKQCYCGNYLPVAKEVHEISGVRRIISEIVKLSLILLFVVFAIVRYIDTVENESIEKVVIIISVITIVSLYGFISVYLFGEDYYYGKGWARGWKLALFQFFPVITSIAILLLNKETKNINEIINLYLDLHVAELFVIDNYYKKVNIFRKAN